MARHSPPHRRWHGTTFAAPEWQGIRCRAHASVHARTSLKKLMLWMLSLRSLADSVSAQPAAPPPPPLNPSGTSICSNKCRFALDRDCDDGGPGSEFGTCALGTDCTDCGGSGRVGIPPPPPECGAICQQNATDLESIVGIMLPSIFLGSCFCLVCCKGCRKETRMSEFERRRLEGRPHPGEAGVEMAVAVMVAVPVNPAMVMMNHSQIFPGQSMDGQQVVMGTAVALPADSAVEMAVAVPVGPAMMMNHPQMIPDQAVDEQRVVRGRVVASTAD